MTTQIVQDTSSAGLAGTHHLSALTGDDPLGAQDPTRFVHPWEAEDTAATTTRAQSNLTVPTPGSGAVHGGVVRFTLRVSTAQHGSGYQAAASPSAGCRPA